jgi:hypothetical protein
VGPEKTLLGPEKKTHPDSDESLMIVRNLNGTKLLLITEKELEFGLSTILKFRIRMNRNDRLGYRVLANLQLNTRS